MNVHEAQKVAEGYISKNMKSLDADGGYVLYGEPKEDAEGWYFFYQSAKYVKTRDINDSVVGNWPIFVNKQGICLGAKRPPLSVMKG